MESYKAKKALTQGLIHLFLIVFTITMLVPFLWMVLTAFKTQSESTAIDPFVILPSTWHFDNFVTVWNSYNFLLLYKNTLLMILFRVLCAVLTATMAGYAFGRLEFPGKKILFAMVLIQMMVPAQIFIIPQYIMVSKLKWINTIAGLAKMQGQFSSNFPQLMAAATMACLPMIVLYLIFQKQFVEGIATSGGKL